MNETHDTSPVTPTTPDQPARRGSTKRTLLITGGAVLAAVVLAGGGVALGAALADDDDDDRDVTLQSDTQGAQNGGSGAGSPLVGAASAAELLDVIETASAAAEGNPVDIEALRGGEWDVQFETAAGDETEVRVRADGSTRVVSTDAPDQDDQAPVGQLDAATVEALVSAAQSTAEGTIIDISIDDDTVSPYSVTILTGDNRTTEIDLDAAFAVIGTDVDTDD